MAVNRPAPALQTPGVRPISFLLDDSASGLGTTEALTLYVRPEELTRQDPSRVNVTQTLGGAWADSFGPGVAMINIAGHTGWRRDQSGSDGEDRFLALRERVFDQWHQRRAAAIKRSADPSGVQLVFSDALDSFAAVVAPLSFTLRRSRSRPLLLSFNIQMAVLKDGVGGFREIDILGLRGLDGGISTQLGLESLFGALQKIEDYANQAKSFVDRELLGPVTSFMNTTAQVYRKVYSAVKAVDGVASSLLNVAAVSAQAGANIFRSLSAVAGLPARIKGQLVDIGAAYLNIFCVLKNSLKSPAVYDDYSPLYGASNCSSTSGGRAISPLAGVNAFTVTNPAPQPPIVGVTPGAQASLQLMSGADVVLAPLPISVVASAAGSIASGVLLQ